MRGDALLYSRSDALELSWHYLAPLIDHWEKEKEENLVFYPAGSPIPREITHIYSHPYVLEAPVCTPTHNIINNIMNQTIVQFYPDATKSLIALTNALLISAAARTKKPFYLALSGGETARSLFEIWKNQYNDPKRWKNVHFFWVDERCVSSENEESNYHWAEKLFFKPVGINPNHIYRIQGEDIPYREAERYSRLVAEMLPDSNGVPQFDCTLLGIGEDEHIASIFNNDTDLLKSDDLYAVSRHPATGQRRITQTGEVILASREILIALVGERKKELLHRLVARKDQTITPATYILSHTSRATIFTEIELNSKELSFQ